MKTSSKILIGLLSGIFFIMSAIFIDIRLFGLHGEERFTKNYTDDFPLENFRHVIIENTGSFEIATGDKNYIHFQTISDTLKSTIQYKMYGDTLKITGYQSTHFSNYTLYSNSTMESITIKNSEIRLSRINQDSIRLQVVDGALYSYENDSNQFSHLKHVMIQQVNSKVNFETIKIDTLAIQMEKSNARFEKEINQVSASIHNESELNLKNADHLELVKDESSQFRFW